MLEALLDVHEAVAHTPLVASPRSASSARTFQPHPAIVIPSATRPVSETMSPVDAVPSMRRYPSRSTLSIEPGVVLDITILPVLVIPLADQPESPSIVPAVPPGANEIEPPLMSVIDMLSVAYDTIAFAYPAASILLAKKLDPVVASDVWPRAVPPTSVLDSPLVDMLTLLA